MRVYPTFVALTFFDMPQASALSQSGREALSYAAGLFSKPTVQRDTDTVYDCRT